MNIIEAIKSGKLFKRTRYKYWCSHIRNCNTWNGGGITTVDINYEDNGDQGINVEDFLADDWEIKE